MRRAQRRAALLGIDQVPILRREANGPEIGAGIFKFKGNGEGAIVRFADAHDTAGLFGAGGGINEREFVAFGDLVTDFEKAAVGVDDEREGIHDDNFSVIETSFQA